MKSYKINRDEKEYEESKIAMAEIGANNSTDTIDVIFTSYYYSKKGIQIQFDEKLIEDFKKKEKEYIEKRPIEDDSIYEGLLMVEEKYPSIGIIIEPSQTMNKTIFPFGSKYILSAIMWYLKEKQIYYKPIDIREIIKGRIIISAENIPICILCGGNYLPSELKNFIKEYINKGGVLFLIGGMTRLDSYKEILGSYYNYFKEMTEDIIPVSPKYGYNNVDVLKNLSFYFLDDLKKFFGEEEYKIIKNPNTPDGWQKPICTIYNIEPEDSKLEKLIKLTNGKKEIIVAGIIFNEEEKTKIIFIPEYFFSPFIFSDEDTLKDPSTPYLDSFNRRIIDFVLNKVKPKK